MGISFANPLLAWGALAAAIPVLVHLLQRRRPKPHPFPAIELVRRSQQRNVRRLRLRRLLLLAARTLILLAIPLALARPQISRGDEAAVAAAKGPAATAIVLDASLSMQFQDGHTSLFTRARDDAREILAALAAEEPVTVVICDGSTPQAGAPSFDRGAARRRLDDAEPTYLPADLTSCVTAAASALGESPLAGKRIHVVTDLTATAWRLDGPAPTVPTEEGEVRPEVIIVDATRGRTMPNRAIVDLAVAPAPELGGRGQAFTITVRNFGDLALADLEAELLVGDEVVAKGFLEIAPHGAATKKLTHRFPAGGIYQGKVRLAQDGLAADDERSFVVQVPRDLRALVVDGAPSAMRYRDEAFFVDAALRMGGSAPIAVTTVDAESLPAQELSTFDLLLLLNVRAQRPEVAARIAAFVEDGGGLFISLGDQVDADAYNASFAQLLPRPLHLLKTAADPGRDDQRPARFSELDHEHPILRIFAPGAGGELTARTWRYFLLQPGSTGRILASFGDGAPALIEGTRGKGRILLYTSTVDRDWSDWPIQTSFLPTMQQAAAYLSRAMESRRPRVAQVGGAASLDAPESGRITSVRGPDGRDRPLADGRVEGIDRPGIYEVALEGAAAGESLTFAAHVDPRESDTRRIDGRELEAFFGGDRAQVEQGPVAQSSRESPLWSLLAAFAVLAFASEGFLIRRS